MKALARRIGSKVHSGPRLPGPNDLEGFLAQELREPGRGNVAFFMVAIEDLGRITDEFGRSTAKAITAGVAEACQSLLRNDDLAAPISDDRVGIVLTALPNDLRVLDTIAGRIQRRLGESVRAGGNHVVARTRIGIATAGAVATPGELLQRAQMALDQARWTIRPWAVDNGELHEGPVDADTTDPAVLQWLITPRLELATSTLTTAEVMVDTGSTPETLFDGGLSALADALDLALGALVRIAASAEGQRFHRLWLPIPASVMRVSGLGRDVLSVVDGLGVTPDRVGLELVGRDGNSDIVALEDRLENLERTGIAVRLSTVFDPSTTLADMTDLQTDLLRLGPDLTGNIANDRARSQLVAAVTGLAQALGVKTLAHGVRLVEDLDVLTSLGVTYAQGILIGEPREASI
ncbi:MAG: EAL domain-containing protein [Acidimicrobiales bacterium]